MERGGREVIIKGFKSEDECSLMLAAQQVRRRNAIRRNGRFMVVSVA